MTVSFRNLKYDWFKFQSIFCLSTSQSFSLFPSYPRKYLRPTTEILQIAVTCDRISATDPFFDSNFTEMALLKAFVRRVRCQIPQSFFFEEFKMLTVPIEAFDFEYR